MTKIKAVVQYLEQIAPPVYQESYDNAGLIVGDVETEVTGVLCCLDSTEAVIEEALRRNCNLVVAHHPIVFRGLKRLTGRTYVERTLLMAIKNDVAIYAIHTNLDNVYHRGVNAEIATRIGLERTQILAPKAGQLKRVSVYGNEQGIQQFVTDLPKGIADVLSTSNGVAELLVPPPEVATCLLNLERAQLRYVVQAVENADAQVGSGMIGWLPDSVAPLAFLKQLKTQMAVGCVKYTALPERPVQKVAVCGGAGGFLLRTAIGQKADVFITSDYKYHEFFDADKKIIIVDIGHFESEQFTIPLLRNIISDKFTNFAALCTEVRTNPVNYL